MGMNQISIVTVAMNRTEHLLQQVRAVSMLRGHGEHIVLDFGSTIPISRDQLPSDERIKLHRVESPNGRWWLTHSYNLAFALASGDYILKLDSDVVPSQEFIDSLIDHQAETDAHLMCDRLTLQEWRMPGEQFLSNGLFLCKISSFNKLNGFNPYVQEWGWDEIDLYSRFFLAGYPVSRLPQADLQTIKHDDSLRVQASSEISNSSFMKHLITSTADTARRSMSANHTKNKWIAISSIKLAITWPTQGEYRTAYSLGNGLPCIPSLSLFTERELELLYCELARKLLRPSDLLDLFYRFLRRLSTGPYSVPNSKQIVEQFGIDLSIATGDS
jgi:glycosyltransferase involved in cell wall biosynthesis